MPKGVYPRPSLQSRFWARIRKTRGCWQWVGLTDEDGYGRIGVKRTMLGAHRVSWEFHRGAIPEGLCVLHTCDNPACMNPDHLFLGTNQENTHDRYLKGRSAAGENNGNAKLSRQEVRDIRKLSSTGRCTRKELASRFNVTSKMIGYIVRRQNWRDL